MEFNQNNQKMTAGLLAGLGRNPEVISAWYNSQQVKLDGYKFIKCRFDNCELHISSTNFELEDCYIDESTIIVYVGEIVKPIRLFNSRYDWVYQHMPYFAPKRSVDGTITITA